MSHSTWIILHEKMKWDMWAIFMKASAADFLCALRCIASRRAKIGSPGAAAREPAAQGVVSFERGSDSFHIITQKVPEEAASTKGSV
jgi:hypothetical protein